MNGRGRYTGSDNLWMVKVAEEMGDEEVGTVAFDVSFVDKGCHVSQAAANWSSRLNPRRSCHRVPRRIPTERHARNPNFIGINPFACREDTRCPQRLFDEDPHLRTAIRREEFSFKIPVFYARGGG